MSNIEHRTPNDFTTSDVEIHLTAIVDSMVEIRVGQLLVRIASSRLMSSWLKMLAANIM